MAQWQQARAARAAEDNDYNDEEEKRRKNKRRKRRRRRLPMPSDLHCPPLPPFAPLAPSTVPRVAPILLGTASARAFAGDAEHQVEPIDPPTSGPEGTSAGRDMTP